MDKTETAMDYNEHRRTFDGFTKTVKYAVISCVVFMVLFYAFVIA